MLNDYQQYASFVCSLPERFPGIVNTSLTCYKTAVNTGIVRGILYFSQDIRLYFFQRINFDTGRIISYGYEVRQRDALLYYYDSQPHPDDPTLTSTHPHHKHIPPDIKHHRIPASELRFDRPNLEFLIREIETNQL